MKKSTILKALDRYPGSRFAVVFRLGSGSPMVLLACKEVPLDKFAAAARKSDEPGVVNVNGLEVKLAEEHWDLVTGITHLHGSDKKALLYRPAGNSRNYTTVDYVLVSKDPRGHYHELMPGDVHNMTFDEFLVSSYEAVKAGKIIRSDDVRETSKDKSPSLRGFFVEVGSPNGFVCACRLDYVLITLKNAENPRMYGGVPSGAVLWSGAESQPLRWRIAYERGANEAEIEPALGTTDHVVPLSCGGRDALVNMQLMREDDNHAKGNRMMFYYADFSSTADALAVFTRGLRKRAKKPMSRDERLMLADAAEVAARELYEVRKEYEEAPEPKFPMDVEMVERLESSAKKLIKHLNNPNPAKSHNRTSSTGKQAKPGEKGAGAGRLGEGPQVQKKGPASNKKAPSKNAGSKKKHR